MQTTGALLAFRAYPQAVALARTIGFERMGQVGLLLSTLGDRLRRTDTGKPGAGALGLIRDLVPHAAGVRRGSLRRWLLPRMSRRVPQDKLYPGFFQFSAGDDGLGNLESMVPGLAADCASALARLSAVINGHITEGRYPGAQVAVARRGRLAVVRSFGDARTDPQRQAAKEEEFVTAILAQVTGCTADPPACDSVLAASVAAQAAAQVLMFIDRASPDGAVTNGTLELVLPGWQWRRRTWQIHPRCGCGRRGTS